MEYDLNVWVMEARNLVTKGKNERKVLAKLSSNLWNSKVKTEKIKGKDNFKWEREFSFHVKKGEEGTSGDQRYISVTLIDCSGWISTHIGKAFVPIERGIDFDEWFTVEGDRGQQMGEVKLVGKWGKESRTVQTLEEKYELKEELGRGAFSIVYRAIKRVAGETVAVKKVNKQNQSPEQLKLLRREVEVMRKLKHPNIVELLDVFDTPDYLYLVIEYVAGGELYDLIVQRGTFTEKDAAQLVYQILNAVAYMHANGIAHRDLKPENLLCPSSSGKKVKIGDFGLSKDFGDGLTALQTCCGSPSYVAPEVLSQTVYGVECDIWSIGVITYVLLSGYLPFFGETQDVLFRRIQKGEYSFSYPCWKFVSNDAKDFISKCLTVIPDLRPEAEDLIDHKWIINREIAPKNQLMTVESMRKERGGYRPGVTDKPNF